MVTTGAFFIMAFVVTIGLHFYSNNKNMFTTHFVNITLPTKLLEEQFLPTCELVRKHGYLCETHTIVTSDGYILDMHRIPYGKNGPSPNRPIVYLQHGLLASSADWVIPYPEKGFGYILADAGYDVWMGNARGNTYSRKHILHKPDLDPNIFWDFSWHEIGVEDVPAMIDYVIAHTKQEKMFYIGHSQGTTVFYVMCSEKPEYNKKIRAMFSMSPVAYMHHLGSLAMHLSSFFHAVVKLAYEFGWYEFYPRASFIVELFNIICSDVATVEFFCAHTLLANVGYSTEQTNISLVPAISGHLPAGASTKQAIHYMQLFNTNKFRKWDYGIIGNKLHYNTVFPPEYNLTNIEVPVYLIYSPNDWLSTEPDVMRLYKKLRNAIKLQIEFSHVDYLFGVNAADVVYKLIIAYMKKYE